MCTFKKICVTNRHLTDRSLYEQLKIVFAISKPDVVILREKDLSEDEYRELAYKVKLLCDLYSVRLIVNKYYEVARELGTVVQLPINDYESNVRSLNGLSVWVSVGSVLVRGGRLSARLAIASRASRIWAGIGRPRRVAFSIREMPSLDR